METLEEYTLRQRTATAKPHKITPKNSHVGKELDNKTPTETGQRDRHVMNTQSNVSRAPLKNSVRVNPEVHNNKNELMNRPINETFGQYRSTKTLKENSLEDLEGHKEVLESEIKGHIDAIKHHSTQRDGLSEHHWEKHFPTSEQIGVESQSVIEKPGMGIGDTKYRQMRSHLQDAQESIVKAHRVFHDGMIEHHMGELRDKRSQLAELNTKIGAFKS